MFTGPWAALDVLVLIVGSFLYVAAVMRGIKPRYVIPAVTCATLALTVWVFAREERAAYAVGLRWDNFDECAEWVGPATLISAVVLVGYGWWSGRALWSWRLLLLWPLYFLWGLIQQGIFQGILNRRLQESMPDESWVVPLVVGVVFSLVHAPRWWLVFLTAIIGPVWAAIYCVAPNLFALALSHAMLGGLAYFCVAGEDPLETL
jgi:membrane protease YdiL (CAAX protease family)